MVYQTEDKERHDGIVEENRFGPSVDGAGIVDSGGLCPVHSHPTGAGPRAYRHVHTDQDPHANLAGGEDNITVGLVRVVEAGSGETDRVHEAVTVEDAAELQLSQKHVITLEARPANLEGEGEITIRDLASTEMACMDPDGVMDQEQAFLSALRETASYNLSGDRLEFLDTTGSVRMVFEAAPASP